MPEVANIAEKLAPEEIKKVEKPELKPDELAREIKVKLENIKDPKLLEELKGFREMIRPDQKTKLGDADITVTNHIELLSQKLKLEIPELRNMGEKEIVEKISSAIKIEF